MMTSHENRRFFSAILRYVIASISSQNLLIRVRKSKLLWAERIARVLMFLVLFSFRLYSRVPRSLPHPPKKKENSVWWSLLRNNLAQTLSMIKHFFFYNVNSGLFMIFLPACNVYFICLQCFNCILIEKPDRGRVNKGIVVHCL